MSTKKNLGKILAVLDTGIPNGGVMDDSWGEYADYNENKMLIVHLEIAHVHAQRALNALYSPSGPKRGLWYRLRLGRAQNALISLHMQELRRMKTDGSGK